MRQALLLVASLVLAPAAAFAQAAQTLEAPPDATDVAADAGAAGYSARAAMIARGTDPDTAEPMYAVHAQPNRTAATTAALNTCLAANPAQNSEVGYCELTHSNGRRVATSTDLLARDGSGAYPLFLWRVSSPTATVYLGGSIHILKAGLHPLAPQYQAAFDASDYFVTEVDLNALKPQTLQFKYTQYGMLTGEQTLGDVMPPELYMRLDRVTSQYGLPLTGLVRFKPAFVTQQLAVLALISVGYDPNEGMEAYFEAQRGDKTVLALETIDFQLSLLLDQPMATQVAMIDETIAQLDDFEVVTAELIRAWLYGDDQAFRAAFEAQSGDSEEAKAFMVALLDKRNVGMVDQIQSYLAGRGTYFVLAGAAHYIGENGIVELLERRGVGVQRIHSDDPI